MPTTYLTAEGNFRAQNFSLVPIPGQRCAGNCALAIRMRLLAAAVADGAGVLNERHSAADGAQRGYSAVREDAARLAINSIVI